MFDSYKRVTHSIVNMVSAVSRPTIKTVDALVPRAKRKQFLNDLVIAGKHHILAGTLSEASIRVGKEYFLSPGASRHLMDLSEEDLDVFSIVSDWALKKLPPPTHKLWHQWAYQLTPAKAVMIVHPIYVYKSWLAEKKLIDPGLGGLFSLPEELIVSEGGEVLQNIVDHPFMLIPGQGLLAWGNELRPLIWKIDELNWICALRN